MYMSNMYVNFLEFYHFLHEFVIKYQKKNTKNNNPYESYGQSTKFSCTYSCLMSHAISPAYTSQLHIHFFARLFFAMRDFPALSCLTLWYDYLTAQKKEKILATMFVYNFLQDAAGIIRSICMDGCANYKPT